MKTYLVTGGAGFIGSNFVEFLLNRYENIEIIILDKLTYAGNLKNLENAIKNERVEFVKGDICNRELVENIFSRYEIDYIVNFAAESHVDNSIESPMIFTKTNILGTQNLMDVAKKFWSIGKDDENYPIYKVGKKFLQISTDEVYGSLEKSFDREREIILDEKKILAYGDNFFDEKSKISPRSPYSASKASADILSLSYFHTYRFPINITRCSNNYGEHQHEEKLIPKIIKYIEEGRDIPIYGDGKNVRDWLYVGDHAGAIDLVLNFGKLGEIYNIGGFNEKTNIDIVKIISRTMGKEANISYVSDRLGHDRRYAINPSKIVKELGWKPKMNFQKGIEKTIEECLGREK